jgi:hypothetical protein
MSINGYNIRHPGPNTNLDLPTEPGKNNYFYARRDPFGNSTYVYGDENGENHYRHTECVDGSTCTNSYDSDESRKSLTASITAGNKADYVGGGQVSTTDGPKNDNNLAPNKSANYSEVGMEIAKYLLQAMKGYIIASKKPTVRTTLGASKTNNEQVTQGNDNEKVTGSKNFSVEGDYFHSTGESRYDVVKNGEYAVHVQNGTLDVLSKKTVRITGDERVILTCGSSYILMLPNKIEIVADRVDINPSTKTIDVENLSGST